MRIALHPDGMAPRTLNLSEWSSHLLHRVRREAELTGDPRLTELAIEAFYPANAHTAMRRLREIGADGT